ncbi:hypothetical protein [Mucilaginibacter polytrichastri]|uniref:Uncharacterized protein n=1 Tax=Mucilaginibacter polytrichastri TaxID=1302689 RepID=A0A1Q5ZZV0_9SPHI|nr:hypothetical protein [Mucilaginibacter polytrichastri]OKS87276.1 hypothetical protein RG47T_2735 [Mucilaginibacter polytrichastri]SFT18582.1 hypothetical protein SAMN04487890_11525 [Mucilaginibacter polytrichastri]
MKLTKNQLIKATKAEIEILNYREVKDTITGAQGLYIKSIDKNLYLTLGLTISKYYESKFTRAFYLSKLTSWSMFGGDIPKESYQRVGRFLTIEERSRLLESEYSKNGVIDAWWDISIEQSINNFIEAIRITEGRFLNQPHLIDNILRSNDVSRLETRVQLVIKRVNSIDDVIYKYIPTKPVDDIPMEWFKAAELVLIEEHAILNANAVKSLGADAYRQNTFKIPLKYN